MTARMVFLIVAFLFALTVLTLAVQVCQQYRYRAARRLLDEQLGMRLDAMAACKAMLREAENANRLKREPR
jgi:hypothetical protein